MTTTTHTPLTMLVCCHKADVMATQAPYLPIQVGKALATADLGIQGDNTGNNISLKNPSYCELTGMYWAWKNLNPQPPLIGLCHYRRYFDFHHQCRPARPFDVFPSAAFPSLNLTVPQSVINKIKPGTAVVNRPWYYTYSIFFDYCSCHISTDFKTMAKVVKETQPKTMRRAFYRIMYCNNALMPANMFIMTWHDFDEYCSFLFPILAQVESQTDISHYNPVQRRVFGFLAERLFNVWLYARHMHLIRPPMIWVSDEDIQVPTPLHRQQVRLRGWLSTKISNPRTHDLAEMKFK